MVQVTCPRGPRTWVSTERSARAGAVAERAGRVLGYVEDVIFCLADRQDRLLAPDELVAEGESYALIVQPRRECALW